MPFGFAYYNIGLPAMNKGTEYTIAVMPSDSPVKFTVKMNFTLVSQNGVAVLMQIYPDGRVTAYQDVTTGTGAVGFLRGSLPVWFGKV